MKLYRQHNCSRKHRTYRTLANCMIPQAEWIVGNGQYALIAWCEPPTATLWADVQKAETSKADIDRHRCGSTCRGRHEIVRLVLP